MRLTLTLITAVFLLAVQADAQDASRKSSEAVPGAKQAQSQRNQQSRRGKSQRRNPGLIFNRLDKNQDKVITPDEVPEKIKNRIAKVDTDGNGEITMREFAASMRNRQTMQGGKGRRMGGQDSESMRGKGVKGDKGEKGTKGNRRGKGMGKNGEIPSPTEMLARLDRNFDQVLTEDEVPERMKKKFSEMDKNGDNHLDEKELVSVVERLKAAKQSKGNRYETDPNKSKGQMPKRPPRDG